MKTNFLLIPIWIYKLKDISISDKNVLGLIYTFREKEVYISNEYISNILGISVRQASRSINKLEELKYIKTYIQNNKRYIWKQTIGAYHYIKGYDPEEVEKINYVIEQLQKKWSRK